MKKRILITLLAGILAVATVIPMALPVGANGECTPPAYATQINLLAGQSIDVGTVYVWNDATTLYVKYKTDSPWLLTETHLQIATSPSGIPKTKTGNPIPGQFTRGEKFTTPQDWVCYSQDMGSATTFTIAAHAVVQKTDTYSNCLVSGAGSDQVLLLAEDSLNPGYPIGYFANYQTYTGTPTPSVLAWVHGAWAPYGISGADWISSNSGNIDPATGRYLTEDPDHNTWRLFTRSFTIPVTAVNISGTMTVNCDNAEDVYLNTFFVGDGSPAVVYGGSPSPGPAHGWSSVEGPWSITPVAGTNSLWIMTRNYGWPGGAYANPTGLIYKLCYSYDIVTKETAWADGTRFVTQGNWATYFTYTK